MQDLIKQLFCRHEWIKINTKTAYKTDIFGNPAIIKHKELIYQCPKCLKIKKIRY